jgi:hypothetical protein
MNTDSPWHNIHVNIGDLLWLLDEDAIESLEIQQGRGFRESKPLLRTLPKPPCPSRFYFKKRQGTAIQTSELQQVMRQADDLLQRAFSNNDYLLAIRNITLEKQVSELNAVGIVTKLNTIKAYKEGKHKSINLVLPSAMAVYHGEPLIRFLTQDYAAQKLAPFRQLPPRDLRLTFDRLPSELRKTYCLAEPPVK